MQQQQQQLEPKKYYKIEYENIFLVPYLKQFVPVYHQWMQCKEILYLTGSEPLTLEEELENHKSWLEDPTKYTFISFLKKDNYIQDPNYPEYAHNGVQAGDINLFFHYYIEENEAEIDVMVGEKSCRNQGIAQKSIQVMMDFGRAYYKKNVYIAKIKDDNKASIKLFTEKFNFVQYDEQKQFNEIHYKLEFKEDLSIQQFQEKYKIQELQINE